MSTKSHFIYENGIEGYEETLEGQYIFGKFKGYNVYLLLDNEVLERFRFKGHHLIIETKNTTHLPKKFELWGADILDAEWDEDGLMIILEGGGITTEKVRNNDYQPLA